MLKTHLTYLRKAVRISVNTRNSDTIIQMLENIPGSRKEIYGLIRDITADARFYSVTDIEDDFWKIFGAYSIMLFIDSLPEDIWQESERLGLLKEDFLNDWLSSYILPLPPKLRLEKETEARHLIFPGSNSLKGILSPFGEYDGEITDCTDKEDSDFSSLPESLMPLKSQKYMGNKEGGEKELDAGRGEGEEHDTEIRFLQSLDPGLLRLAKMIGRSGGESIKAGKYRPASKSDISGITSGNDLNSVIPSELAMLASPQIENIFLKKFTSRQLQLFSSASSSPEKGKDKGGPIYICVDTSGSMNGDPEVMAKTLAMAISIIAQKERRPVILINYSDKISFFVLLNLRRQKRNLLTFLSNSYGGGNNEALLFKFLFKILPSHPRYKSIKNLFKGADLLVISDFLWCPLQEEAIGLIKTARNEGLKIYTLGVDFFDLKDNFYTTESKMEGEEELENGFDFFAHSDYRFEYNNGFIREA